MSNQGFAGWAVFTLFWFTCSLILPPLCFGPNGNIIPDRPGSIGNGTCNISTLGLPDYLRPDIDTYIYDDLEYNKQDIFISAMNQLFEPFAVVRDFLGTYMAISSRMIFWGIVHALF